MENEQKIEVDPFSCFMVRFDPHNQKGITMKLNRRNFLKGGMMAAGLTAGTGLAKSAAAASTGGKKFYKGQFHTHTWWSDGRAAPEQAVQFYRERGYDFLGLTDHNVYAQGRRTKKIKKDNVNDMAIVDAYRRDFPAHAVVRDVEENCVEVELKTCAELRDIFERPGEFVLLDGVEGTTSVVDEANVVNQVHMSYLNVPAAANYFTTCGKKGTVAARIGEARRAVRDLAEKMGRDEIFILNHPVWTWYDVLAEDLIANPDVGFFELCNGGSPFGPGKGLPRDGRDGEIFWDVVNAFRARRGEPLLYGVGADDTHYYFGTRDYVPSQHCVPLNAWCKVRAAALSQPALIAAMKAGDFAVCEGVEPEDFSFDSSTGTLTVSVAGKKDLCRTIQFFVTKKDFSEKPVRTVEVMPPNLAADKRAQYRRTINIYDEKKIGCLAKSVTGGLGEPVCASYKMAADDLYVRARIKSPEAPVVRAQQHPKLRIAWTQPYLNTRLG